MKAFRVVFRRSIVKSLFVFDEVAMIIGLNEKEERMKVSEKVVSGSRQIMTKWGSYAH